VKLCRYCGEAKPLESFHKRLASQDGRAFKCRACQKAYAAALYAADPERFKAKAAAWAAKSRARRAEIALKYADRYRERDRSIKAERARLARAKNPIPSRAAARTNAQARRATNAGKADGVAIGIILRSQRGICAYCGKASSLTLDHVVALARGGTNHWSNFIGACRFCNGSKHALDVADWVFKRHGIEGLARALLALKIARKAIKKLHPAAQYGFPVQEV